MSRAHIENALQSYALGKATGQTGLVGAMDKAHGSQFRWSSGVRVRSYRDKDRQRRLASISIIIIWRRHGLHSPVRSKCYSFSWRDSHLTTSTNERNQQVCRRRPPSIPRTSEIKESKTHCNTTIVSTAKQSTVPSWSGGWQAAVRRHDLENHAWIGRLGWLQTRSVVY